MERVIEGKPIRIDVFDGDQRAINGPRPKVVSIKRMKQQGDFLIYRSKRAALAWCVL